MNKLLIVLLALGLSSCATNQDIEKIKYDAKDVARKSIIRRNMEPVVLKGDTYYNLIEYVIELQEANKTCQNQLEYVGKVDE